jgi:hypothetical protein
VSHSFDVFDSGALCRECARVWLGGTDLTAVRTGLFAGESLGLLLEEQLERSFGQSLRGSGGDLLEGAEVDIEPRPVVAECSLGNNFGPLSRKVVKFLKLLGRESRGSHASSCPEVTSMATSGLPIPQRN